VVLTHRFKVGGFITYKIKGTEFTVNLWPDTITVVPDPALYVK